MLSNVSSSNFIGKKKKKLLDAGCCLLHVVAAAECWPCSAAVPAAAASLGATLQEGMLLPLALYLLTLCQIPQPFDVISFQQLQHEQRD